MMNTPPAEDKSLRAKRVAVLLYSYFPSDPRPRRAALAMAEAGAEVDFFCLRGSADEAVEETVSGIRVRRLSLGKDRGSKLSYVWQYGLFIITCLFILAWRTPRRRYDLVHVHNMPDILVFAAVPAKLAGAGVILDLHDPMPELMTSIYQLRPGHWLVWVLQVLERWSIWFADLVFTPNITFKNLFVSRGCPESKIQIIMNSPQDEIFDPAKLPADAGAAKPEGEYRVMHHGSIVHRHGIDLLVQAVAEVRKSVPGVRLDIYGVKTPFLDQVLEEARRCGVTDVVHYHGGKTQKEIALAIRDCHVGVVPNRRSPFTETNFPTRLFEYLAMERPVIAPSTLGIRDYFGTEAMLYFEPDNVRSLADQLLWVWANQAAVRDFVGRGAAVYRQHLWRGEKERLVQCAERIVHSA